MTELGRKSTEAINAILKNHGIAEVKIEKDAVVVVDISRKVKCKEPQDEPPMDDLRFCTMSSKDKPSGTIVTAHN